MHRTHTCGEITENNINLKVALCGWVNKRRDFGKIIFIDLRDRFGLIQLVIDTEKLNSEEIKSLRNEWVIKSHGIVRKRSPGMENRNLKTGNIEIDVLSIEILSESKTPPFSIFEDNTVTNEELRLKYRFLDIRRKEIQEKIILRSNVAFQVRKVLTENNFIEVTTPVLCKSTPEGARDYLVPSRLFGGNFYALPQSPQLFKQLLMIGGIDRYFQLPICFRDEDPRADRQPEFTQIDIEMSFAEKEDLFKIAESMVKEIFKNTINEDVKIPISKMFYHDALEKYGTDKPDLRFGMELIRIEDILKKSTFQIFLDSLKEGAIIKAINVKCGSNFSRKNLDEFTTIVKSFGLKGLTFIKKAQNEISSSILKFLDEKVIKDLEERLQIEDGDLIIIACDKEDIVNKSLDHLRRKIAKDKNLCKEDDFKFVWIVDFPLFELDKENNTLSACHHPFTSPREVDLKLLDSEPLKAKAEAYDLVLNGYEIAGGSKRIFRSDIQKKIFSLLNLTDNDIEEKFGFFIEALKYGTPPHLGIAFGFDRLMMLLTKTENIRDVIAFPKTLKGLDLMMNSPSFVNEKQLSELSIKTTKQEDIHWQ